MSLALRHCSEAAVNCALESGYVPITVEILAAAKLGMSCELTTRMTKTVLQDPVFIQSYTTSEFKWLPRSNLLTLSKHNRIDPNTQEFITAFIHQYG